MGKESKFYFTSLVITIIGIFDSAYLAWIKVTDNETKCIPGFGECGSVNLSAYSEFAGIPVAVIGLAGYITILGILVLHQRNVIQNELFTYLYFGITLVGFLFSMYLTYVEIWILHAICGFCVISAVCMTLLFFLSLYKIRKLLNN